MVSTLPQFAQVAKLVDALALGASVERREGSNPSLCMKVPVYGSTGNRQRPTADCHTLPGGLEPS